MEMNDGKKFEELLKQKLDLYSTMSDSQLQEVHTAQVKQQYQNKLEGKKDNFERPIGDDHTNAGWRGGLKIGERFVDTDGITKQKYAFKLTGAPADIPKPGETQSVEQLMEARPTLGYAVGEADFMDALVQDLTSAKTTYHNRVWKGPMAHKRVEFKTTQLDPFGLGATREGNPLADIIETLKNDPSSSMYKYKDVDLSKPQYTWTPVVQYRQNKEKDIPISPESLALNDLFLQWNKTINEGKVGERIIDKPGTSSFQGSQAHEAYKTLHTREADGLSPNQKALATLKKNEEAQQTGGKKSFDKSQKDIQNKEYDLWKGNQKQIRTAYFFNGEDITNLIGDELSLFKQLEGWQDVKEAAQISSRGHVKGYTSNMSAVRKARVNSVRDEFVTNLAKVYGTTIITPKMLLDEGYDVIYPDMKGYINSMQDSKQSAHKKGSETTGNQMVNTVTSKDLTFREKEFEEWEKNSRRYLDLKQSKNPDNVSKIVLDKIAASISDKRDVVNNYEQFNTYLGSLLPEQAENIKKTIFQASLEGRPFTDIDTNGYSPEQAKMLQKGYEAAIVAMPFYDKSKGASMETYLYNYVKAKTQPIKGHKNVDVVLPTTAKKMVDRYPEIQNMINEMYVNPQYETYRRHNGKKEGSK